MKLISTASGRDAGTWSFREALFLGQAPDGGLFVPNLLSPPPDDRLSAATLATLSFRERAYRAALHLLGDELSPDLLAGVVADAFNFPVPLRRLESDVWILELYHGPTLAFKDFGARFMARMFAAVRRPTAPPLTVLVATSGDTGGAVAHAFRGVRGVRVLVLYPAGRITEEQKDQIATLGHNITAVAVRGTFDDCLRVTREGFSNKRLNERHHLTSANSINVARLIPQTFYYLHALVEIRRRFPGRAVIFSVPSGNFGNLVAGLLAQRSYRMAGVRFVASTNTNSAFAEWLARGKCSPRPLVPTMSSAMDVSRPSNLARLLWTGDESAARAPSMSPHNSAALLDAALSLLRQRVSTSVWSDAETRACIREVLTTRGILLDPHTAVGLNGLRHALQGSDTGTQGIVLATAHPAKFRATVAPLIGSDVSLPERMARLRGRARRVTYIDPTLMDLAGVLHECLRPSA